MSSTESGVCVAACCDRRDIMARGYCKAHYQRWYKGKPVDGPLRRSTRALPDICSYHDCPRPHASKGYCQMHLKRSQNGAPMDAPPRRIGRVQRPRSADRTHIKPGEWGSPLDNVIGPAGAHSRVRKLWGSARQYPCIAGCGQMAEEWAYDGTDPTQMFGEASGSGVYYSRFPEFYMPMCKRCHRNRDRALAAAELREYREWKHRTGKTLREVS